MREQVQFKPGDLVGRLNGLRGIVARAECHIIYLHMNPALASYGTLSDGTVPFTNMGWELATPSQSGHESMRGGLDYLNAINACGES